MKTILAKSSAFLLALCLVSCSTCYDKNVVYGADEFVLDSYQIQEGKWAIIDMMGSENQEEAVSTQSGSSVYLIGSVEKPEITLKKSMTLFDVLAEAKIPTNANLFKSYIARRGKILPIDFYRLLCRGDMSQNIEVEKGDKIYIADPYAATILVMGEVVSPRVIPAIHGFLPLREAIAKAKGIAYTGDLSYIQVIRGGVAQPKIYLLSWEHILRLPNTSLLLIPGDIVYVASTPITEWNRFFSQLIPNLFGGEVVVKGVDANCN